MKKFFRKTRLSSISSKKFSKYFFYAVGEIFLVVLGILIALQVNNFNEGRKRSHAEIELYHKIFGDLISENKVIRRKINSLKSHQNLHFQIYAESQGRAEYDPTMSYKELYLFSPVQLFFNENHLQSLSQISDNEVLTLMRKYISQEKVTFTSNEEWNKIKVEQVRPFLGRHGIKNTKGAFDLKTTDDWESLGLIPLITYPKLAEQYGNVEFDQLLYELRINTTWSLYHYNLLLNENQEFVHFLEEKLGLEGTKRNDAQIPVILNYLSEDKTVAEIVEMIRQENHKDPTFDISEIGLTRLGYNLITDRKVEEARMIFEVGIELYPKAYNLYDSYGECLVKLRQYEEARIAFEKALELNPESLNSQKLLKFLNAREQN